MMQSSFVKSSTGKNSKTNWLFANVSKICNEKEEAWPLENCLSREKTAISYLLLLQGCKSCISIAY